MTKRSCSRILAILAVSVVLALVCYVLLMLFLLSGGIPIPPQDCMATTFSVRGYVLDEQNNPLQGATIRAFNDGSFSEPAFGFYATSDQHGYFETGHVSSFACTPFDVEITAPDFQTQTLTFYPPSEQWSDELPTVLNVTVQRLDND